MKRLFMILLLFPIIGFAQKKNQVILEPWSPPEGTPVSTTKQGLDPSTHKYTMEGVIDVQGEKNGLYDRALAFLAKGLGNSNWAIQIRDKETGKIVTNANVRVIGAWGVVSSNITLLFKDNKFKYVITDFAVEDYGTGSMKMNGWNFEQDVSVMSHGVSKKQQIEIRENTFDKYKEVINRLKTEIVTKKNEFEF